MMYKPLFPSVTHLALVSGVLNAFGCGAVDTELFSRTNEALVENLGEACDLGVVVASGERIVEDDDPACLPGYCVGEGGQAWTKGDQGICTCRCDGPDGTGPLCECADGFQCKHLIDDIGNLTGTNLVGAYCVPKN